MIDGDTDEVSGKHVAGVLYAGKSESEALGKHFTKGGFSDSGSVFDQKVSSGKKAGEGELYLFGFAENNLADGVGDLLKGFIHKGLRFVPRVLWWKVFYGVIVSAYKKGWAAKAVNQKGCTFLYRDPGTPVGRVPVIL